MRKIYGILYPLAGIVLLLSSLSCQRENFDRESARRMENLDFDDITVTSSMGGVKCDANKLRYNVTADLTGLSLKGGLKDDVDNRATTVELASFKPGKNPQMPFAPGAEATKSIYDQITTRDLNSNFLRLDETIASDNTATGTYRSWDNAQLLEANVIATPDNTDNLFYRTVTFTPSQSYMICPFNYDEATHQPQDTIFYHTRMIAWYPMICSVPRGSDGDPAVIQFKDNRYSDYRATLGASNIGVVFDHVLDGETDLMMSNMCEAQRWHRKDGSHYSDLSKSSPEENYCMPFGHNDKNPHYSNPFFYHHYLSAIRVWAKVDQSGDDAALNLLTWGKILNVSVVNQPSTVTIALPTHPSSAVSMDDNGLLVEENGKLVIDESALEFGAVHEWSDFGSQNIKTNKMYGEGDINHSDEEYSVSYPIDMTNVTDYRDMESTYLGYFLVKPCVMGATAAEDEVVTLSIQTEGGTYQVSVPCRAIIEDEESHSTEEVEVFQASKVYDVILNLRTTGTFSDFIGTEGDAKYEDLSPYDETTGGFKTANSYIVPLDGLQARFDGGELVPGYSFIADIIGNGQAGILSSGSTTFHTTDAKLLIATDAKVLWQSNRDQIFNVQYQHGYIRFQLKRAEAGNAVIVAMDSEGKIVWSWHIWITNTPGKVVINNIEFMNCNLGATWQYNGSLPASDADRLASYGLYYQWGRKDPIPTPAAPVQTETTDIKPIYDEFGAEVADLGAYVFDQCETVEDAIAKPMHFALCSYSPYYMHNWIEVPINFLWGKSEDNVMKKSIYDPCPFGYRVVHEELQGVIESSSTSVTATDGYGLVLTNAGQKLYLPYAGFYGPDRNYTSNTNSGFFMGSKGDYTSGTICPSTDSDENGYFSDHRLRTYISQATSWTSENIDGVASFTYRADATKHYVYSSITSQRDYGNRKTAGSVRCVSDESYMRLAYAHITPVSAKLNAGGNARVKLSGGVSLGAIQNATLTVQYTDEGGASHSDVLYFVRDGVRQYDPAYLVDNFNGTFNSTQIEGNFDYPLPAVLPSDEYSFTFYVQEASGDDKTASCVIRDVGLQTLSLVSSVSGNNTDGVHPYAGQAFTLTATIKCGPCTNINVARTNFTVNGVQASSANASTPDANGMSTVTVVFNSLSFPEAGLDQSLTINGSVTMDGNPYPWTDTFHSEVWDKKYDTSSFEPDTDNPYTTLADAAGATKFVICNYSTGSYLYNNNGTPAVSSTFVDSDDYYWTVTSNGVFTNVGAAKKLNVPTGSGTAVTFTTNGTTNTVTYSTNGFYIRNTRYLYDSSGSLTTSSSTGNTRLWLFYPVRQKVLGYQDPHIDDGVFSVSGANLHDGHPGESQEFNATYYVTVNDADNVTFASATINGKAATGTVTPVGDAFRVSFTANDVTVDKPGLDVAVPITLNLRITSAALGLSNANVTQQYLPSTVVYKRVPASYSKGDQITSLADLAKEEKFLLVNRSYTTRYTVANGTGFTNSTSTTIPIDNDNWFWKATLSSGSNYYIQNVGSEGYLYLQQTTVSLDSSEHTCVTSYSGGYFRFAYNTGKDYYYFRQSGNTTYSMSGKNKNDNNTYWYCYKVNATYNYVAPTE